MTNITKLLPVAGSIAVVCLVATAAATYAQANIGPDSTAAEGDQVSRQQLWNFAITNAEGFNAEAASLLDTGVDTVAKGR